MSTLDLDLVPVPDLLLLTYTRKGSTLLPAYCVTCRCPCYSRPPRLNWGRCSRHPATPPKYCDNRWLLPHSRGAVDTHPAHKQAHTRAHTRYLCMHACPHAAMAIHTQMSMLLPPPLPYPLGGAHGVLQKHPSTVTIVGCCLHSRGAVDTHPAHNRRMHAHMCIIAPI